MGGVFVAYVSSPRSSAARVALPTWSQADGSPPVSVVRASSDASPWLHAHNPAATRRGSLRLANALVHRSTDEFAHDAKRSERRVDCNRGRGEVRDGPIEHEGVVGRVLAGERAVRRGRTRGGP